jgi:hypothetical protein
MPRTLHMTSSLPCASQSGAAGVAAAQVRDTTNIIVEPKEALLVGFRVLGFVGAFGVDHSINEPLSLTRPNEYLLRIHGGMTVSRACLAPPRGTR